MSRDDSTKQKDLTDFWMFWKWQYVGRNANYIEGYTEHDKYLGMLIKSDLGGSNMNEISSELISAVKEGFFAANASSLACEIFDNLVAACNLFLENVLQCERKDELLSLLELLGPLIKSLSNQSEYAYEFKRDGIGRLRELFMSLMRARKENDRYAIESFKYFLRDISEISDSGKICSDLAENTFAIPDNCSERFVRAYCPQDDLGEAYEHDGEISVPYVIRMSSSLEQTLAEVEYLYNSFSNAGNKYFGVPPQIIREYHGLGFSVNNNPRAVGLWLWDYIQEHYGRHKGLPHGAKSNARKAFKAGFDVAKLGYAESDARVFDRLYTRTNECIQKPEVLTMK